MSVPIGRDDVVQATERLLDVAQHQPVGLALEGDAGMGKTTVWLHAVAQAVGAGHRVLQARPAESETGLAYLGVSDLVGAVFDDLESRLPPAQARALAAALLRGDADDQVELRAVATAFTTLLAELATEGPVLVAVDDVQWLDPASERVLDFAARRLPQGVKILLTARETPDRPPSRLLSLPGDVLSRVVLQPLSLAALRQLVLSRVGISLSRPLLTRVTAASAGNPLFVLEICRALVTENDEPGPTDPLPVPSTLQRLVTTRVTALPAPAQQALLVAAALSRPTSADVVRAVGPAGEEGLAEALAAEVIVSEHGRIRFTHPLFASAVYGTAPAESRQALHRLLAEVVGDADERARHLSAGVTAPDSEVADELELAAVRATHRGAQDAAAELFGAAVRLTPATMPHQGARRLLGQAAALNATGSFVAARSIAHLGLETSSDAATATAALSLLGSIEWYDGEAEAATRFVERAVEVAGTDQALLAPLHTQLVRLNFSWDLRSALEHAVRAQRLLDEEQEPAALATVLVDQLFGTALRGERVSPQMRDRALDLESRSLDAGAPPHPMVLLWLHCTDDLAARDRSSLEERWYADRGEEVWVADRLSHLAVAEVHAGDLQSAERHAELSCAAVEHLAVGGPRAMIFEKRSLVDAHRGRVDRGRSTLRTLLADHEEARQDWWAALTLSTLAFVEFAAGDHLAADAALVRMHEKAELVGVVDVLFDRSEPFHVETLLALGDLDRARTALERLEERGRRLPRPWITAALPRTRALVLAEEGDLDAALAVLTDGATGQPSHLPLEDGWTLLVKGRIERRARLKRAAAESLGAAVALFEAAGATALADRAGQELARVGLRRTTGALSPTERMIVEHACAGMTNLEIAQAAFISKKTVEANLTRIYRKLGIRSRAQLSTHLLRAEGDPSQT